MLNILVAGALWVFWDLLSFLPNSSTILLFEPSLKTQKVFEELTHDLCCYGCGHRDNVPKRRDRFCQNVLKLL